MPQSTFSTMLELCSLIVNDCGLIKISNNWYFNKNHALWDIYKKTQIFEKVEIRDTTLYQLHYTTSRPWDELGMSELMLDKGADSI